MADGVNVPHMRTASFSQFCKNDEAKMTEKWAKVMHGKKVKETSGK